MFLLLSASNTLLCLLLILSLKISQTLQRNHIQSLDHKKSKHGENSQGKNYSQSHALRWQILHWNSRLLLIFILDKLINNQDFFSICGCFWWRDLVSVLLCVCGLHNCLCISFVKVKTMFLIPKINIFPFNRYIDIRSMDPLDRDHKGLKIKKKQYAKSSSPEEQKCFFKEEWRCLYDPFYLVFILLLFVNIYTMPRY